jgi:hypothetical protein
MNHLGRRPLRGPATPRCHHDHSPDPYASPTGQRRLAGWVHLDFHQATCDPAGLQDGSSRIDSLPVRYRILGRTRTADVPLDDVTIAVNTIGRCDHALTNQP